MSTSDQLRKNLLNKIDLTVSDLLSRAVKDPGKLLTESDVGRNFTHGVSEDFDAEITIRMRIRRRIPDLDPPQDQPIPDGATQ